jgi:hypothetical protein
MLAAERTNRLDTPNKKHRHSSTSLPRKSTPLLLVEQQTSNHVPTIRSQHVRFSTSPGTFICLV